MPLLTHLLPNRGQRWPSLAVGVTLIALGFILLGAGAAYYSYTFFFAGRNLDRLNEMAPTVEDPIGVVQAGVNLLPGMGGLFPGGLIPARQWADPRGTLDLGQDELLKGFTPVTAGEPGLAGDAERADRIIIPALDLNAKVEELGIINLGNSQSYETPKFTVGHIPTTAYAGSEGHGWYFGHLESPIEDEGNVFARLPKVPDLLRAGEDVYVILETASRQYLYRVAQTTLIHQTELRLSRSEDARITLVTCFPRLKYDHRLLITASLIGFRDTPRTA